MKNHLALMVSLCVILALGFAGFAQAAKKKAVAQEVVPEEAKRYFGQGKAIAKRAKSPQDYEEAIRLFEKAASLAPTWADIYDDLAYAQENVEKYPEAIKSLRKYLTLAPSYVDVKNYEVRIYELEEKMKYKAGPGSDVELAQKLVGTWVNATKSGYWEFEATSAKVLGKYFNRPDPDRMIEGEYYGELQIFDAEVRKSRLVGTSHFPGGSAEVRRPKPLNVEVNLSPDGRSLRLGVGELYIKTTEHFLKIIY